VQRANQVDELEQTHGIGGSAADIKHFASNRMNMGLGQQ
jgi:hypothetical protein